MRSTYNLLKIIHNFLNDKIEEDFQIVEEFIKIEDQISILIK